MLAEGQLDVLPHLLDLGSAHGREPLGALPEFVAERGGGELPLGALLGDGRGGLKREQRNGLVDSAFADVDQAKKFRNAQAIGLGLQGGQNGGSLVAGGKGAADEPVSDVCLFVTAQQNTVGRVQRATCTTDLLVIGNHRAGHLVVDDERQVRLVVSHAQRRGGDECFDLVLQQGLLKRLASVASLAGVGLDVDSL